jgi:hypothetical protein
MQFYTGRKGVDRVRNTFDFGTLDTLAYASGDILTSTAIAVSESARSAGEPGELQKIILKETNTGGTLQRPALRVWLFGSALTPAARNSPQAFTSAQMDLYIGFIDIANADWINNGTGVAIVEKTVSIPYRLQPASNILYLVPEIRGAFTFHSTARITGQTIQAID